jgi:hypothetical protein
VLQNLGNLCSSSVNPIRTHMTPAYQLECVCLCPLCAVITAAWTGPCETTQLQCKPRGHCCEVWRHSRCAAALHPGW